jgi:LysR family glycine cleavage system transcriptional activator
MGEDVYPVCSPALARRAGRLRSPVDLAKETLIHDLSMDSHANFPSWNAWLKNAGVAGVATRRAMRINNSAAVLQAAMDGQGIALARSVMARDDLAAGRLVRLFPAVTWPSVLAYFVVYRPERANFPRLVAFRDWILAEAAT